jgi:hypothetical protein
MKDHDNFGLDNILQGVPIKVMDQERLVIVTPNMTAKEYAAIHLKVPRSGDPDIDAMIRESRRAEFAGRALSKLVFPYGSLQHETDEFRLRVNQCFRFADALLAEWEGR